MSTTDTASMVGPAEPTEESSPPPTKRVRVSNEEAPEKQTMVAVAATSMW